LVRDLVETMQDEGGAGLAAPQLGGGWAARLHLDVDEVVATSSTRAVLPRRTRAGRGPRAACPPGCLHRHQARQNVWLRLQRVRRPAAAGRRRLMAAACTRDLDHSTACSPRPARRGRPQGRDEADPRRRVVRRGQTPHDQESPHSRGNLRRGAVTGLRLVFRRHAGRRPAQPGGRRRLRPRAARRGHPPRRAGRRGRHLVRSPAAAWADEHGVEVLTPQRPREPEFQERLRRLAPDCVPVVAYGALVPPSALGDTQATAGSTCTSRCCPPGGAPRPCSMRCCTATR